MCQKPKLTALRTQEPSSYSGSRPSGRGVLMGGCEEVRVMAALPVVVACPIVRRVEPRSCSFWGQHRSWWGEIVVLADALVQQLPSGRQQAILPVGDPRYIGKRWGGPLLTPQIGQARRTMPNTCATLTVGTLDALAD